MKISLNWLKTYCPVELAPEALAQRLLLAGFPVESIEPAPDGDTLLDVEVTSNRPDLLGHLGMAREAAALTGAAFNPPAVPPAGEPASELPARTSVENEAPAACPCYTARLIEGVTVKPSPAWLARRIEAIGLRPVNNVVDVTNFVLFEYSQPLHAFDHAKLGESRIVVRMARPGEQIVSIDGHARPLDPSMLVIADSGKPVAVAGVMGGLDSEVSPETTTVLLESAYFDPLGIRATARKLGLFSDSSFRFERGVDPAGVIEASNRAAALIVQVAGGRALDGMIVAGSLDAAERTVSMRLSRMRALIGVDVSAGRAVAILDALRLSPKLDGETVAVRVPSFRQDLVREVDLIEEVARVEGYDTVPVREHVQVSVTPPNFVQAALRRIARALAGLGFFEAVNFTFLPAEQAELFADAGRPGHLEVQHPSRRQENALRRSLLPSLLADRRRNETVQVRRADLFEIADVFHPGDSTTDAGLPDERLMLALCSDGPLHECRGALEQVIGQVSRHAKLSVEPADDRPEFAPGRAGRVLLDGQPIGLIGELSDALRARFELSAGVTAAEIELAPLLTLARQPRRFAPLARFPAIERDLSIFVDEGATWQQIASAVRAGGGDCLEAVEFLDLFHGKQVPAGKKSLTFTLRFRRPDGTLTHAEADGFVAAVVARLGKRLGAVLRDR